MYMCSTLYVHVHNVYTYCVYIRVCVCGPDVWSMSVLLWRLFEYYYRSCFPPGYDELKCHCGGEVLYPPVACGTRPPSCSRACARMHACEHTGNTVRTVDAHPCRHTYTYTCTWFTVCIHCHGRTRQASDPWTAAVSSLLALISREYT